nr:hypothetical protein [Mesorhizobium loti]
MTPIACQDTKSIQLSYKIITLALAKRVRCCAMRRTIDDQCAALGDAEGVVVATAGEV